MDCQLSPKLSDQFPFDPTYGYDLKALLKVTAPREPKDFKHFWEDTFQEAESLPLNISRRQTDIGDDKTKVEEIEFDSLAGVRIGGWLTTPREIKPQRAVVVGHGYGGRAAPDLAVPGPPAVAIFPCARGFNRSAHQDFPPVSQKHVLHGIDNKNSYIHRGCAADLWRAASALLELYPQMEGKLDYHGGSFGGGIGALMLPWDHRFGRAYLRVPSFGHHPLRVTLPCQGSGQAVRQRFLKDPSVLDVLAYFDAATAARHIKIPVLCQCALFDPNVPPPGQFAVYNALNEKKKLLVNEAGHFDWPKRAGEDAKNFQEADQWLKAQ